MKNLFKEPFRPFFLIASLFFMLWCALWSHFALGGGHLNPIVLHQVGFSQHALGTFAIGFLLTAWPHFTQTPPLPALAIGTLWVANLAEGLCLVLPEGVGWQWLSAAKWLAFGLFLVRGWIRAKHKPLVSAPWLAASLVTMISQPFFKTPPALQARLFMTTLIVAVGCQMVPALCGVRRHRGRMDTAMHWALGVFLVGVVVELYLDRRGGFILQALTLTCVLVWVWQLGQRPERSLRGWGLWGASWMVAAGYWAAALFPAQAPAWLHLTFIGGFVGITTMVVCQVITAHCELSGVWLQRFYPLGWILGLILVAAVTRVSAGYISYMQHLGYAAATLLVAAATLTALILQKLKVL